MNRIHPNSVKPVYRPPGLPAGKSEEASRGIEQRHWVKLFVTGLLMVLFGMLEFMGGRPEISNIFNDPKYASYWVLIGIAVLFVGFVVRTWGRR
jgi:hypothetical protein